MTKLYDVKVAKRYIQGQDISIIELESPLNEALPSFSAGAHIDVHLPNGMIRQYSLCQDPAQSAHYRLAVLKDVHSRGGSQCVFEQLHTDFQFKISAPKNLFALADADHSILIGGGIGITPLISMAYQLYNAKRSFELHYCGRNSQYAAFIQELKDVPFAASVHFHFKDDGADHRAYFQSNFAKFNPASHIYSCGPNPFMDWVMDLAKQHQFPAQQLHKEVFQSEVELGGATFEVFAQQSNKTIQVAADETILDALAKHGIAVEKSCEQGVCGTCMCDVIEGIPEHRDVYLSDEEKDSNELILVCCSRAQSSRLVLDI